MNFISALLAIALLQFALIATEVTYTYLYFGFGYGFSSNRTSGKTRSALGKRIKNTLQNQVESNSYAVPVLAAAAITSLASPVAMTATFVHVIARITFALLYFTGLPFLRVPAWVIGWMSIAVVGFQVLGLLIGAA